MEDKRDILKTEQPFSYRLIKNDKAQIFFNGKTIKTIQGKELFRFLKVLDQDDEFQIQLFLAKVTGQFKHGNERI